MPGRLVGAHHHTLTHRKLQSATAVGAGDIGMGAQQSTAARLMERKAEYRWASGSVGQQIPCLDVEAFWFLYCCSLDWRVFMKQT